MPMLRFSRRVVTSLCSLTPLAVIGIVAGGTPPVQAQRLGGPMRHIVVDLDGPALVVSFADGSDAPAGRRRYDERLEPPADVLEGLAYNGQFGWISGPSLALPADATIWIEVVDQTPGLLTFEASSFEPLFGTDGSVLRWAWDGSMKHNWYAAEACGFYEATYVVYVGDPVRGDPLPEYVPAQITLSWVEPLAGDLDGDFYVGLGDLSIQLSSFGASHVGPEAGDLDGDGRVLLSDVMLLVAQFGRSCP